MKKLIIFVSILVVLSLTYKICEGVSRRYAGDFRVKGKVETDEEYSIKETANTATPRANYGVIRARSDGKLYYENDIGVEVELTVIGAGDVTAASNIPDNAVVIGDGGAKGVQGVSDLIYTNSKFGVGGTPSNSQKFQVTGAARISSDILANFFGWVSDSSYMMHFGSGYMAFDVNSVEGLRITESGGNITNALAGTSTFGNQQASLDNITDVAGATNEYVLTKDTSTGNAIFKVAPGAGGGISNIVEDVSPQLGNDLDLNGHNLDFPTTPNISDVLDEDNMATNSATMLATQQSIKAYSDSGAQTLTNKTLDSDTNMIHADTTYIGSRNVSGSTITAGSPVYASGYNVGQDKIEIELSDSDSSVTMPAIGITEHDILNNANGHVIVNGNFDSLDTTGTSEGESWSVGDKLYVSPSIGELTNVKPTGATEKIQAIAVVVRSHATLGRILVQGAGRVSDIPNDVAASDILIALGGGSPTVDQIQEYFNNTGSAGYFEGGTLSDGGSGTLDVAAGSGFIRTTNDDNAELQSFKWSASSTIAVADNTTQYVYVDDSGAISLSTNEFLEAPDKILIGVVTDEGAAIESVFQLGVRLEESVGQAGRFMRHVHGIVRNVRIGGLIFGQSGDANRDITMTTGQLEWGRTSYTMTSFDTSGADTFATYSANGLEDATASQWPNAQYDNAGTLTTMTNNSKWANLFFWVEPNDKIIMVYGRAEFNSEAGAEAEGVPSSSLPTRISETGLLAVRFTFQKSSNTADIESAFDTLFANAAASDHGNLSTLAWTSAGHTGAATTLAGFDGAGAASERTAGRSLTLGASTIDSDDETVVYLGKIAFENPVAGDDFFFDEILAANVTFKQIYAKTLVGTVDFDITIAGVDINGTDITATTGGVLDSSLAGDTSGSVGEEVKLEITSVASAPTYIMIKLYGTYDD